MISSSRPPRDTMPASRTTQPRRLIAWLDSAQAGLVRAIADASNLHIIGAGSPTPSQTSAVASACACPPIDDLRVALTEADADIVLLASLGDFGQADAASDAPALLAARSRRVKIASLIPFPTSAIDLSMRGWLDAGAGIRPADVARVIPLPRHTRAFRDAAETLSAFSVPRSVHVQSFGHPCEGSLASRLVAAIDTIVLLMGEPETIDASVVSPLTTQGVHALPGETLSDLHGDLAALLRFADGRTASIFASDHASAWTFSCTLLGSTGRLTLHDSDFELLSPVGERTDESHSRRSPRTHTPHAAAVATIAEAITRLLDPHIPDIPPPDWPAVLSIAQAALLAARTGQPESPQTFRAMMQSP